MSSKQNNKENGLRSRMRRPEIPSLIYGKMAPQAPDLEGAVLGAIMLEPDKLNDVMDIITSPECFYSDANQRVFAAIRRLYDKHGKVNFMLVCEDLRKNSELEMVGGSWYVTSLTTAVVSSAHIEEHSRIVMQKYLAREAIRISGQVIGDAYENSMDVFDLLEFAQTEFEGLTEKQLRSGYKDAGTVGSEVLLSTADMMGSDVKMEGIPTGWPELDKVIGGWEDTSLIILAARPAIGKSAFALNTILEALTNDIKRRKVGLFSLEMSAKQLVQRMFANMSGVELNKIRYGLCDEIEFSKLETAKAKLAGAGLYIDDTAGINIRDLRTKAKIMKKKHGVGLLVIDYLQLMGSTSEQVWKGNREQEVSAISRSLKQLAKELELPIIALSQLNRDVENRTVPEPFLHDLRESGSIEQDADVVIFLYQPKPFAGVLGCKVAKNRHDKEQRFTVSFIGALQRFHSMFMLAIDNFIPKKPDEFKDEF